MPDSPNEELRQYFRRLRRMSLRAVPRGMHMLMPESGTNLLDETEALLAAMDAPPPTARRQRINNLIGALIEAGVWAKIDALWVFAAHDAQAALLNWKDPGTFDASVGGGEPTFLADRHYATDGSDDWIETGFNPSTAGGNFGRDSACWGLWNRLEGQAATGAGWFDGSDGIVLNPRNTSDLASFRINQGAATTAANTVAQGLFVANRSLSNATQLYKNGVSIGTGTPTSTALNNHTLNIGRQTASTFEARQYAAALAGGSLSAGEHLALYNALAAYMTAVGA